MSEALKAKGKALREKIQKIEAAYKASKAKAPPVVKKAGPVPGAARAKEIMAATAPAKAKAIAKKTLSTVIDLEEDAAPLAPTNDAILQITQMCQYVRVTEEKIADLTAQLATHNKHRLKLLELDIPEAMKVAGLKALTLEDGAVVSVDSSKHGSYTKENEAKVFDWLRKHGHESLIKNVIEVKFGKGEEARAQALIKVLETKKFTDWAQKQSIHANTFKAFVREQLEAGAKLPKTISIFEHTTTSIKEKQNGNQSKKTNRNEDKF